MQASIDLKQWLPVTNWTPQASLKAFNPGGVSRGDFYSDSFGGFVAISGDTVVVGAWQEDSNASGVNATRVTTPPWAQAQPTSSPLQPLRLRNCA